MELTVKGWAGLAAILCATVALLLGAWLEAGAAAFMLIVLWAAP